MMHMIRTLATAAFLLVAACSGSDEGGNNSSEATGGAVVEQQPENLQDDPNNTVVPLTPPNSAPNSAPGAGPSPAPSPSASPVAALPAEYQGRWGLVSNDCVPGRSDAKGLMIVSVDALGFYESRGRIDKAAATRPGTFQLDLAFTGEGQEWNRRETLTLLDAGKTLVREEQKPAGSFRYIKCPAGEANLTPRENGA